MSLHKLATANYWYDSAFLLLKAGAKPCPRDVTLHAVACGGERGKYVCA